MRSNMISQNYTASSFETHHRECVAFFSIMMCHDRYLKWKFPITLNQVEWSKDVFWNLVLFDKGLDYIENHNIVKVSNGSWMKNRMPKELFL